MFRKFLRAPSGDVRIWWLRRLQIYRFLRGGRVPGIAEFAFVFECSFTCLIERSLALCKQGLLFVYDPFEIFVLTTRKLRRNLISVLGWLGTTHTRGSTPSQRTFSHYRIH